MSNQAAQDSVVTSLADSLQSGASDSLNAGDSTASDSTSTIDALGDQVGQLSDLVVAGRWEAAWLEGQSGLTNWAVGVVPTLLRALIVGALFYGLYRLLYGLSERVLRRGRRANDGVADLVLNAFRFGGLAFVGVMILSQFGLNVTAALAGLGIAGLALGFAAKDTLENFISGLTILLDQPFKVGDTVEVEGVYGRVSRFTLRSTRIRTLDRRILVMPNVRMINQKLLNHSALVPIRVEVPFSIAYKESIDEARDVVLGCVDDSDDRFDSDNPSQVVVKEMSASSIDLSLWLSVREATEEVPVRLEYTEKVRKALGEADIEIPYPHLQLFIDGAQGLDGVQSVRANGNVTRAAVDAS